MNQNYKIWIQIKKKSNTLSQIINSNHMIYIIK